MTSSKPQNWETVATAAKSHLAETLSLIHPPLPSYPSDYPNPLPDNVTAIPGQVLTVDEIRITELLPEEILAEIAGGKLAAVAVANAFMRRAGVASHLVGFP